jgi:thiamine kinase-like enzyme
MTDPPVPRCYDAVFDDATGRFHVLLEDLSETHCVLTTWPLPPDFEACERIVDAWARFHAGWWRDPRLGNGIGETFNADAYAAFVAREFPRFVGSLGDRLSRERRERCERMVAAAARIAIQQWADGSLTLIHGDAHVWNVLCPKEGMTGGVNIIDWDNWRPAAGARDLAYMMAVHWYPERRRRFERELLLRYQRKLEAHGVAAYDMGALWRDYRLAVIQSIGTPLSQAAAGLPPLVWWGHLERIMLAYEDLGCEELMSEL